MTDIEEKNKETTKTLPLPPGRPVAAQLATSLAPADTKKDNGIMSKGEKLYNRIVYQGINYWLNLGLSLYFTDIFTHGGGKLDFMFGRGKRFYDKGVKGIAHTLNSSKLSEKTANRAAEVILGTFTLNTGGNVLLIPMKLLEDRKRPVVHWLNKNIFKEKQLASDGHEETPDEIYIEQEQPKQSWLRVIGRRVLAVSTTIVTGLGIDWALKRKLKPAEITTRNGETHEDGTKHFTRLITTGADHVLNSGYVPGGKKFAANDTAKRYMGYAALDTIYTWITATVMHRTNGAKHLKKNNPKEAELFRETGKDIDLPDDTTTNGIKTVPEAAKVTPASLEEKLGGYKTKPHQPAGKYTDLARAGESDYTLAP